MALNWSSVTSENVTEACELVLKGEHRPKVGAKGIFVIFKEQQLPAKHVARLAYCLANRLPLDSKLKFSSGDGIINLLQKRGQVVTRVPN